LVAVLCAWLLLHALTLSWLEQGRSQQDLYDDLRQQLAAQTAPTGAEIEVGAPVALLSIPTLGLEQVVVEGTASGDLQAGPGHRRNTVLPGQAGVSIVYGRTTTYGAPFRSIGMLRAGDGVRVTTAQGEFVFRVDGVRRDGDPLPAPLPSDGARLTLVTADRSGALGALVPDQAIYVDATLQGDAVGAPPGRPGAIPEAEEALHGDTGVLPLLALSLQVLVLVAVVLVLLRPRVPTRLLWTLGAPVVVAALWWATDLATQLLPNLG